MTTFTQFASVSFAKTPLPEVSAKAAEIAALGWEEREDGRGDPWAAAYRRDFPEDNGADYEAELRDVMGGFGSRRRRFGRYSARSRAPSRRTSTGTHGAPGGGMSTASTQ
jgi:hypothetical protein